MASPVSPKGNTKPRIQLVRKVYKGILMFENEIEEIQHMDTREDDIWVITYPRSGTTLTQEMVYLIQTLDFDTANKVQLDERFPMVEVKDDRFPYYKGLKFIEDMKSPRMIKSHLHHFLLPTQLQNGKGRIIYMARNPKDVVTSFYRLMQWGDQLVEGDKTFNQFVDAFVEGKGYACPWPRHVLEYWERRNEKNILFLKYEDVVRDLPAAIRTVAAFLGRSLTDEDVARIANHCHVDKMRNNDKVNMSYWRDIKYVDDNSEGGFINKGRPGVWREVLTQDHIDKIDTLLQELDGSGLELEQMKLTMAEQTNEASEEKPRIQLGRKQYKGIWMFDNEIEEIETMDTREDDIWVCTFPRSGTTLTQEITFLVQTMDFDKARSVQLDDRFPIIEVKDDRFPYYRGIKFIEEMPSPRMIKCHLHHFLLPEQLQKGKGRIIYVARNPKDIVTSFYRLMQWGDGLNQTDGTWDLFVDAFVTGTGHNGSWSRHVLEFWNRRNDPNVLFLKYEDLVKDMPKAVRKIADFLDRQITDDDVARICDHCHVDNMRKNDKVNMSYWRDIKKVFDDTDGGFINKGKAGAWKELLTPDKVEKINGLLKEIEGSGLTFDEE